MPTPGRDTRDATIPARAGSLAADARAARLVLIAVFVALFAGCGGEHPQSVLHTASPDAARIAWLWWVLFGVCTAVFLAVLILLAMAILRRSRGEGLSGHFIAVTGIFIPAAILLALLFVSLGVQTRLRPPAEGLTIRVTGHQWWWDVQYPEQGIVTANEIYIPVGEPVRLELRSADVIHSFWVPNLNGKRDLLPDHTTAFWLQADRPGEYRGQCAEFCGVQHARMAFQVVALPPGEFQEWLADNQRPVSEPTTDARRRGREAFFRAECHNCHAIRGTRAEGRRGPDLTHVGSRLTLGAGTLTNNRGHLSGWVGNPQAIKPGNLMPRTYIPSDQFEDLIDYLESLQ